MRWGGTALGGEFPGTPPPPLQKAANRSVCFPSTAFSKVQKWTPPLKVDNPACRDRVGILGGLLLSHHVTPHP